MENWNATYDSRPYYSTSACRAQLGYGWIGFGFYTRLLRIDKSQKGEPPMVFTSIGFKQKLTGRFSDIGLDIGDWSFQ